MCLQQDSPKRHVPARCNGRRFCHRSTPTSSPSFSQEEAESDKLLYSRVIYPDLNVLSLGFLRISTFFLWASHNCTVWTPDGAGPSAFHRCWWLLSDFSLPERGRNFTFQAPCGRLLPNQSLMIIQLVQLLFMIRKKHWKTVCVAVSTVCFFFLRIYFSPPLFNCVFHVVILCIVSIHKFCQCKAWRLRFSFGRWHGMGLCSCSKLSDWQLPSNLEQVQFHI